MKLNLTQWIPCWPKPRSRNEGNALHEQSGQIPPSIIPLETLRPPSPTYQGDGLTRQTAPRQTNVLNSLPSSQSQTSGSAVLSPAVEPQINTNWLFESPKRFGPKSEAPSGPVRVMSGPRLTRAIADFKKALAELKPSDDAEPAWQRRLEHTQLMATAMETFARQGAHGVVHYFDSVPVGMLALEKTPRESLRVSAFVTSPLSEGAGISLGEAALNHSEALGMNGRLEGIPGTPEVKQLYLAMGCADQGDRVFLDPAKSDKWEKADSGWRLKKYAGDRLYGDIPSMNESLSEKKLGKLKE